MLVSHFPKKPTYLSELTIVGLIANYILHNHHNISLLLLVLLSLQLTSLRGQGQTKEGKVGVMRGKGFRLLDAQIVK